MFDKSCREKACAGGGDVRSGGAGEVVELLS